MSAPDPCPSAAEIAAAIRSGQTTAEAEARAALERIAAREGEVQAWQFLDEDLALGAARDIDGVNAKGPLAGVPVGIKDIIDTADMPTENGVATDKGRRPEADATVVARLRRAGAIILGKTATTECAFLTPAKTRNPHDPTRTPGGSSSGSGAAVGGGMVPLALGSQTVGSVLRPGSFNGAWAMKPTYGLIPRTGMMPLAHSLDHVGVFGRSATDLALTIDVLSGDDGGDWASAGRAPSRLAAGLKAPLSRPRFLFLRDFAWPEIEPSSATLFEDLAKRLDAPTVNMPPPYDGMAEVQHAVLAAEAAHNLWPRYGRAGELISPALRGWIVDGRSVGAERYLAALEALHAMRVGFDRVLGDHDAAIAPVTAGEAPQDLTNTGNPRFCLTWTALGVPVISVPAFQGAAGMPVGVQVIGRRGEDLAVLRAAAWFGRELGID